MFPQFPYNTDDDPANPVDMTADDWRDFYASLGDAADDYIDRDDSMNY